MTKSQIKAELRRSACEDRWPLIGVDIPAFVTAVHFQSNHELILNLDTDDARILFLLVAEAL